MIAEIVGGGVTWTQYMTKSAAGKQLAWAHDNSKRDWDSAMWLDKSILKTGEHPGRKMVTRHPGEEFLLTTIVPTF
ncbi:hypothetical protein FRC08_017968 [Ceratobasidium sp. 394]|nr:hypothetical protein FRC08_017968 [Ceratobasidium sp. 394]KAG9087453.1 hypothetical protein FS749_002905 [Ceratobasidium sp. UAMH 11750]